MSDDLPIPQTPMLVWYLNSLGVRYTLLLPFVTAISLMLIWNSTSRSTALGEGSRLTASLILIVPLPAIVGLYSVVDGLLAGFSSDLGCGTPSVAIYAEIWASSLVGLQVGLWLTLPGMLLTIGMLCRQAALQSSRFE
jgi:hypothetical protein